MFKKNKGKIIVFLVAVIVLGFLVSRFLNQAEEVIAIEEEKSYSVEVLEATFTNEEGYLEYSAIIKNRDLEEVMFPIVGSIKTIYVEDGDTVHKGQLLVTLEDDEAVRIEESAYQVMISAESAMNSAKSNLDLAQLEYDNELKEQENDTQYKTLKENYDIAKYNKETAQRELDSVYAQIQPLYDEYYILEAELTALNEEKALKQAEIDGKQAELNTVNTELEILKVDLASNPENEEIKSQISEKEIKVSEINADISILQQEMVAIDSNIALKNVELETKRAEIAELEKSLEKYEKEAEIEQLNAEYEAARVPYEAKVSAMEIELAGAKNTRDTASFTYDGAKSSYEAAKANYENAQDAVEDLHYYAKTSGIILSVVQSEGEVATPLMPIMVVGTDDLIAEFGVSAEDVSKVSKGNYALVEKGDNIYSAEVLAVSPVPDETSRTYLTEVLLTNNKEEFLIGELVSVKVSTGNETGIFLPINVILNDGEDYVYVVENNRAVRKNIEILSISDNNVMVSRLDLEDMVISKGMKNIKSGYLVSIV